MASSSALSVCVKGAPLPYWVPIEPEDGPAKDEVLKRALDRILNQEVMIDQLREVNELQEQVMQRERLRM